MANPHEPIHETWLSSNRIVPHRFIRPVIEFTRVEAAGGIVLLIAAMIAIIWANSAWSNAYFELFNTPIEFSAGIIEIDETLKNLINDGLMVVFFFVVGLEIKRELVVGELNSVKKASLPALAALGGMVVPALIFIAFVAPIGNPEALRGWGIPMATDIAFSVGVVALLGSRVSVGAKLFLLALAIVDDIGAIVVIAVFYTDELHLGYLAFAAVLLLAMHFAKKVGVSSMLFYVPVAFAIWYGFLESGVHATIAGVVLGLMTPVYAKYSDEQFRQKAVLVLERWDINRAARHAVERLDHDALELAEVAKASVPPLNRLERALHPWSSFVIVPLFALANAGVRFVGTGTGLGEQLTSPIALGVAVGLMVGKPVGVTAATWLGLKLNLGVLPRRTNMKTIVGLGALAGIGFTVSLFVTELAFNQVLLADEAKLGIFLGSFVAGVVGFTILRLLKTPEEGSAETSEPIPESASG
ncbi:MAG: Na+/H+ antiporter NhaA [Acidimicrobiia bacterium]|nr:MAG: Na+/H+ antiporter NhaA [Acidimicrobiia bacterium]